MSAIYDRSRFFIPTNQSLSRFMGNDEWLASMPYGTVVTHDAIISIAFRRPPQSPTKFLATRETAHFSAVRLRPNSTEPGAYLILLAELTSTPGAQRRP